MSSVSSASMVGDFQIAVMKKQLDNVEQQGRNAVALIEAASPKQGPPANVPSGVGQSVNVVA